TDGTTFTPFSEGSTVPIQPATVSVLASYTADPPAQLTISAPCVRTNWQVVQSEPWLSGSAEDGTMRLYINHTGLPPGVYEGAITFAAAGITPGLTVTVRLQVVEQLFTVYTPLLQR
ncbi:MAG: hypothetical protein ACK44M_12575, partial [Chloroflexus sp.]